MEAMMPSVDQETQKIISTYQQIYNLIFKYGIFIVMGVLSLIVVLSLKPNSYVDAAGIWGMNAQIALAPTLIHSGDAYIAKGVTLAPSIEASPLSIQILQGFVSISPEAQMWFGVLAQSDGIILPVSINLSSHDDNLNKEYFSTSSYNPEDLNTYIQNTILTYPVKNMQTTLHQYKQQTLEQNTIAGNSLGAELRTASIPMDNAGVVPQEVSLSTRFGLQCLGRWHLTNYFCYKNIEQFISRIAYMSFDNKLDELSSLIKDIVNTPYLKNTCDNLQYAFSKSPVSDRQWEFIFSQCGWSYVTAYHRIVDFATVVYELQGISNAKLYTDDDINIFKLLSLQQKIYHNTLQKNYDIGTIEVYLMFVQSLLTKKTDIDQVYKDMIYMYNNTYLQSALTQIAILNNNTKAMIRLTDVVKNINEGAINLQRMITNPELISFVDESKRSSTSQTNLVTFQDLFASKFTTFDNFIVTSQKVDNDTLSAQVEGYFIVNDNGEEKKVLFVGDYLFDNEDFTLTYAEFPQSSYLETSLNKLIKQRTMFIDIPFVYEFIKNNVWYESQNVSICDIITARREPKTCNDNLATFIAWDDTINLSFNGYTITNIDSNNSTLATTLKQEIEWIITTQNNIWGIIDDLIKTALGENTTVGSTTETESETNNAIDTNQFTIISKFKQYFDITPEKIEANSGKYLVEFSLDNIDFVGLLDIQNNYKLFPVAIQQWGATTRVNNLSLNLTNAALTEINLFKANPSEYIKKVDQNTYNTLFPTNN